MKSALQGSVIVLMKKHRGYISLVHFVLWFSEMLYQDIMFSLMRFSRTWKD
jgi:hypothetical protein